MIAYLFTWVLFLSLSGLIVGGLTLGIDRVFKERIHSGVRYYIWIAAVAVMLIPIRWDTAPKAVMENAAHIRSEAAGTAEKNTAAVNTVAYMVNTVADTVIETNHTMKAGIISAAPANPEKRNVKETIRLRIPLDLTPMEILAGIWFMGVLCLLLKILAQRMYVSARLYQITKKASLQKQDILKQVKQNMGIKRKIRLLTFQGGMTPFITGIFRNKIYIPQTLSGPELALILRHELTHCRRFDILYKAMVQMAAVVHFFNPVVYLIRKRVDKYCEISCDEQAIGKLEFQEKKAYTIAILNTVLQNRKHMCGTVALGENKSNLRERVEFIMSDMKYSKITRAAAISIMLAVVMVSTLFSGIVNANNNAQAPKIAYSCADDEMYVGMGTRDGTGEDNIYSFWGAKGGYAVYRDLAAFTDLKASWVARTKEECQTLNDMFDNGEGDLTAFQKREEQDLGYADDYEVELKKLEKRYGLMENGLEGTFTVKRNQEIIADDVKGFAGNLPPYEYGYSGASRAELVLMLDDFENEDYVLRISMNLGSDPANRYEYQKVRYDFDKSRDTKAVSLGKLLEASENGTAIDVKKVNERLGVGTRTPVSDTIFFNTKTKQAYYCFVSRVFHDEPENGWTMLLNPYQKDLIVTDDHISGKAGKSIELNQWIYIREYDPVEFSITGLNSGAGGQVQILIRQKDGGETLLKYEIVQTPKKITTLAGTREVSEFVTEGEDVFIGTPAEQDDFDRDEHDRFYKRIIVDENGKVLCVIPVENQQGEMLNTFTQKLHTGEKGYGYTSSGYESLIVRMCKANSGQTGLMDGLTWWITAVISKDNVFVELASLEGYSGSGLQSMDIVPAE